MTTFVAEGRRGVITLTTDNTGKQLATKTARTQEMKGALAKEQTILQYLKSQGVTFVPQIHDQGEGWFTYTRIEGQHFHEIYRKADLSTQQSLMHQLLERAYALDRLGVIHGELSKPHTNILVTTDSDIVIIDFERGTLQDFSGKNMRSLAQRFLAEGKIHTKDAQGLKDLSAEEIFIKLSSLLHQKQSWYFPDHSWQTLGGTLGLLLGGDLATKYFFYNLRRGEELRFLTPVLNEGIGWSIPLERTVVLTITTILLLGIIWGRRQRHLAFRPTVLLLAGGMGNGIDRLIYHGVRDFIDLHVRPVFNGADVYLSIAIILLFYQMRIKHNEKTPA